MFVTLLSPVNVFLNVSHESLLMMSEFDTHLGLHIYICVSL